MSVTVGRTGDGRGGGHPRATAARDRAGRWTGRTERTVHRDGGVTTTWTWTLHGRTDHRDVDMDSCTHFAMFSFALLLGDALGDPGVDRGERLPREGTELWPRYLLVWLTVRHDRRAGLAALAAELQLNRCRSVRPAPR